MTPAAASRGLKLMSLLAAPRSLKEPVVCSCSSLAHAMPEFGNSAWRGNGTNGVSRTTEYTRFAASRIIGSTSRVSIAAPWGQTEGKDRTTCYYCKERRRTNGNLAVAIDLAGRNQFSRHN